jgi:hypothetical protein
MSYDGGGWTLVVSQFDTNPIEWDEGIQVDYDPSLLTSQSFSFNNSEIPVHSESVYNKAIHNAMFTSAGFENFNFNFIYSAEEIPLQTSVSKNGTTYNIYRSKENYAGAHNIESGFNVSHTWHNTLVIDNIITAHTFDYAFSPWNDLRKYRTYAFNGEYLPETLEDYALVVWVR